MSADNRGDDSRHAPGEGNATGVNRTSAFAISILSGLGLVSSAALIIERFELLLDPSYVPSCSINPIISCGTVMTSSQAAILGFPNPILGLVAFTVSLTTGVISLAGVSLPRWYWICLSLGGFIGAGLIHFLIFQSLFRIGALCPYCMVVWIITIPLFVISVDIAAAKLFQTSTVAKLLHEWRWSLVALWYAVMVLLIGERFWSYWSTLL
ncbi:vitamin K epoxide reductase family protein [Rhodococcus cerastii]|nr:vitamin K epoxide reductase family protein [Rhodococcus cerastii]